MCLRGARSSFHQPAKQAYSEVPLDVAISKVKSELFILYVVLRFFPPFVGLYPVSYTI